MGREYDERSSAEVKSRSIQKPREVKIYQKKSTVNISREQLLRETVDLEKHLEAERLSARSEACLTLDQREEARQILESWEG
jgi:molecular chaperone DnaK (HSP70)